MYKLVDLCKRVTFYIIPSAINVDVRRTSE